MTLGDGRLRGFMASGSKIRVWEEIVAVPVGLLVIAIGLPVLVLMQVARRRRSR